MSSSCKTLFVGDLGSDCSDANLAEWFSEFGQVVHTRVKRYRSNRVSMGYGLIKMKTCADADNAVRNMNGVLYFGRKLRVRYADRAVVNSKQWFLKPVYDSLFFKFEALKVEKKVDEQTISSIFSHFGKVVDVSVSRSHTCKTTGMLKGFGFCNILGIGGEKNISSLILANVSAFTFDSIVYSVGGSCKLVSSHVKTRIDRMGSARASVSAINVTSSASESEIESVNQSTSIDNAVTTKLQGLDGDEDSDDASLSDEEGDLYFRELTKFGSTIYSEGTDFTPPPPLLEHTSYFKTHVSRAIGDIQAVNAATGHASAYDAAFVDFRQSAGIDIGFGADPGGNIMYAQLQQLGRQQHAESYHLHNSPKLPQSQNQTDRKRNQQVQKTRSSDNVISKLREEDFYSTVGAGTGLCTVASAVAGHGNDFSVPAPSRYHEGRTEQRDVRHGFDEDAYFRQLSRDHARVKVESSQLGSGYGLHEHSQQQRAPLQQYQHPTFQQSQMPHHRHQQHQQYHEVQHNQQQRLHAQAGQGLSPSIRHLSPSSRPGLSFGAIGEKGRYQPQQISGTVRQQNLLQQQWRQQLQQQQQQILWQQQQQEHQLQQQALLHQQQQQQQGQGHQLQHSYMRNQQTPIDSNDYFGGLAASVTSYPSGTQSLLQHNQLHSIQALHQHRQQSVLQPPVPPQQQSPQQQSQQQSQQQGKFAFGNYL